MVSSRTHGRPVSFLVGKPLRSGSVLADVIERLQHRWPTVIVHRPSNDLPIPEAVFESGIVVQRGLDSRSLMLAATIERAGVRCVNRISATQICNDRAAVMSVLAAASIPVPETAIVPSWGEIGVLTDGQPIVIKTLDGNAGRGINVLLSPSGILPANEPFAGPFIVQHYLPHSSTVQKLYVAGGHTRGLLKRSPLVPASNDSNLPFEIDSELGDSAARIGTALGLDIFGADIVRVPLGPTVIDVNPFPGFRGVADAGRILADHIVEISRSGK